jgi:subtilisin family serine protease
VQIVVREAFSNQYKWRFATTGGGRFDVWSYAPFGTSGIEFQGLPNAGQYPPMQFYQFPDKLKTLVDSWACSDKVITVANYVNRDNYINVLDELTQIPNVIPLDISVNSSSGPTRDNRQKPDIAATGDIILSAGRIETLNQFIANEPDKVAEGGWHYRNGGTSMASPVVAGVAALYLERDSEANWEEVKSAIVDNALADQFTGVLPGLRWGHGKLDAFAALTIPFGDPTAANEGLPAELRLYPNPAREQIFIETGEKPVNSVALYDLSGRLVRLDQPNHSQGLLIYEVSNLVAGVYLLQVRFKDGETSQSRVLIEN